MTTRTWKGVPGFEERYEVSSEGLIRTKPRVLSLAATKKGGHLYVNIGGRKVYIHRLVAAAFLENRDCAPVVNHKNGNPKDNRVENLEWVTYGENIAHGYRSLNRDHYSRVPVVALANGVEVGRYRSITEAAKVYAVTKGAIRSALINGGKCCGLNWCKA